MTYFRIFDADEVAATKSTSYAGCLGCPSLSAPDLQQFLMTSDRFVLLSASNLRKLIEC